MSKPYHRFSTKQGRSLARSGRTNTARQDQAPGQPVAKASALEMAMLVLRRTLMLVFGSSALWMNFTSAQIIADPNAPGRQQATVLHTANGVLQVNVQTPSAAGVSRNVYRQFDVPKAGVVINNARESVQTQLGGWVEGNPWLLRGTARVILNEVNSSNPSQLRGYMEVAGPRAEMVIANPAGIVVDGAGFINVSRATLTTGAPLFNGEAGAWSGLGVQRGIIDVQGAGLDARQTDYTALIARSMQINAGVWAPQLDVLSGANQVAVGADGTPDVQAYTAGAASGAAPRYGIDTALLGGMYANKITLVGTEAGVGVRNAGSIGASSGELVVTSAGRLENTGSIAAGKALQITAQRGIDNGGSVYGKEAVSVSSGTDLLNSGTVFADGALALSTAAQLRNSGLIGSEVRASIDAGAGIDNRSGVIQAQSVNLAAAGDFNNLAGKIVQTASVELVTRAQALHNTNGGQVGATLLVPESDGNGAGAGAGAGAGVTTPPADTPGAYTASTPAPGTDPAATPAPAPTPPTVPATPPATPAIPKGMLAVSGDIHNDAGQIMSAGGIGLDVAAIDNSGGQLNLAVLSLDGPFSNRGGRVNILNDFTLRTDHLDNRGGKLLVGGHFDGRSQVFDNTGGLLSAGRALTLASTGVTNIDGKIVTSGRATMDVRGALDNSAGNIVAGGNLALGLSEGISNTGGLIQTRGALDVRAGGVLDNGSGVLEVLGADSSLLVQGGTVDNGAGRIVNAGTGATQVSAANAIGNSGVIAGGGRLAISAQDLNNTVTGKIATGSHLELSVRDGVANQGVVQSAGNMTAIVGAGFDNSKGIVQAGQNLQITAGGLLNNNAGVMESLGTGATLAVRAGAIDNTAGRIVNVGNGDSLVSADTLLFNTGLVAANGKLDVKARTLRNEADGNISAGGDLLLDVSEVLANKGAISSAGTLAVSGASADVRNSGAIVAGQTVNIQSRLFDNDGGQLATTKGSGADVVISSQALSNRSGVILSDRHAQIGVAGAADNTRGAMQAQANLMLTAGAALNNQAGVIETVGADSRLQVEAGAIDNTAGRIVNFGSSDMAVRSQGSIVNTGVIAGNGNLAVSAATLNNQDGRVQASGSLDADVGGALNNTRGLLQARKDLQLRVAGSLSNSDGVIEATSANSTVYIGAGAIDNGNGRIVNVGTGAMHLTADNRFQSNGLIAGNGTLDVAARIVQHLQGGVLSSGSAMQLSVRERLDNQGAISSGGALDFLQRTTQVNNTGSLLAAGKANIVAGALNNEGGLIATSTGSNAAIDIDSATMSNRGGRVLADGDATLNVASPFDNDKGTVQAGKNLALVATGAITNNNGVMEAGAGLTLQGSSIDNTAGRIVNVGKGDTRITGEGSIVNGGAIAGNGSVLLSTKTLENRAGATLASGGNLDLAVTSQFNNMGAVSSGATLRFEQAGAGLVNQGQMAAGGAININTASLDSKSGAIEVSGATGTLVIDAGQIDNSAGRIVNAGSGETTLRSKGDITNSGLIAGNGKLMLGAQTVVNHAGGTISGGKELVLNASTALDNHAVISSAGSLEFNQAGASLMNTGTIVAGGTATLVAKSINNDKGLIATARDSGADLHIVTDSLSNVEGQLLADGNATLNVAGALNNSGGAVQSGKNLVIDVRGDLRNDGATIEASGANSALSLSAASIDNAGGRITNIGAGELTLASATSINNTGLIAGNGDVNVRATTLLNSASGTIASGKNMTQQISSQLDNQGTLNSGGALTFRQPEAMLVNSGKIIAAGSTVIAAREVNNNGGSIGTVSASDGDLSITTGVLSNQGGHITTGRDLAIDIKVMQGVGEVQGGRDLSLSMEGDYTQQGVQPYLSGRDFSLTVTGNIVNNGTLQAVRNLNLSGNAVSNNAGAVMQGQGVAVKAVGAIANAGEINGENMVSLASGSTIDNSNVIVGGAVQLAAQNLNNRGASTLLGATRSLQLGIGGTLNNEQQATIYSAGSLDIAGTLSGGAASVVNNNSSTIEAGGDLSLATAVLNNVRENVTLEKFTAIDETTQMVVPSWYQYGSNKNQYDAGSSNYAPHEVYFVHPDDILENQLMVAPDGNTYGRAVIRTHANDSAFLSSWSGLYGAYGSRSRITTTEGTRVLYYITASAGQSNPDQGGPADNAYYMPENIKSWNNESPAFSADYGSCSTNCMRFMTQPGFTDPNTIIIRDTVRGLPGSGTGYLEASRQARHIAVEDRIAAGAGPKAQILSGGNMQVMVGQSLLNRYGDIMASGTLNVGGGAAISNEGATLYREHQFGGT